MVMNMAYDYDEIVEWLSEMQIRDYDICDNGKDGNIVHVAGDVDISNKHLGHIPIQFGYVSGHFNCDNNSLDSLMGCPDVVGGSFGCSNNLLTSLVCGPSEVGIHYDCKFNFDDKPDVSGVSIGGEFFWWWEQQTK